MSQSEQNLSINLQQQIPIKKYKKIRLTGLAIPVSSSIITTIPNKPSPKQQSIQKSSSSSEQQTFYENYFQNSLEQVIQHLIGNNIQYQIDQLKQSKVYRQANNSDIEFVDVVIKVQIYQSNENSFYERIKQIKQKQYQKKSKNQGNIFAMQKKPKPLEIFIKQKQVKSTSNERQRWYEQEEESEESDGNEQQIESQIRLQSQDKLKNTEINQTYQQIIDKNNSSSINLSSKHSQSKTKNHSKSHKKKKQKYNKVQSQQNQVAQKSQEPSSLSQQVKRNARNKLILFIGVAIGIFFILFGLRLFYTVYKSKNKEKLPQVFVIDEQNKRFFNGELYRGNLQEKFKKKNFLLPLTKQDQYSQLPLYVQTLPPVNFPSDSLHPKKIPYRRPTTTSLYTYPDIFKREFGKIKPLIFTNDQKQIVKYLAQLEKQSKFPFPQSLYRQIQKQPNKQLLLQAQYIYLQNKYNISFIEKLAQRSLCIVSISKNMLKSNKYLTFFTSLLSQNYSNYRLIYIDNGSDDEFQLPKVMNHLSNKFNYQIGKIGSQRLYFLRNQLSISQSLAKDAAIKEFCADEDIVIDINEDSLFMGRQSLRVISLIYNNNPFRKVIKAQTEFRNKDSQNKIIKNKENMPNAQSMAPSPSIWIAYSNYLYAGQDKQTDIKIKFGNSSKQINQQYEAKKIIKNSSSSIKKLSTQSIFDICLKTYVVQLEAKLNVDKLVFKAQPLSKYTQISDTQIFINLLELAGKFDNTSLKHTISLDQPFCYKNTQNFNKQDNNK